MYQYIVMIIEFPMILLQNVLCQDIRFFYKKYSETGRNQTFYDFILYLLLKICLV